MGRVEFPCPKCGTMLEMTTPETKVEREEDRIVVVHNLEMRLPICPRCGEVMHPVFGSLGKVERRSLR